MTKHHAKHHQTGARITITLETNVLRQVDKLVANGIFFNRSQVVKVAVEEMLERVKRNRLAVECAKLNPKQEKAFAERYPGWD
jgi:Arc/MetJ-type ribon-helix-helix transcriptional regulator